MNWVQQQCFKFRHTTKDEGYIFGTAKGSAMAQYSLEAPQFKTTLSGNLILCGLNKFQDDYFYFSLLMYSVVMIIVDNENI